MLTVEWTSGSSAPSPQTKADYVKTLNSYYEGRPLCVWSESVKFPVENATADEARERGFDALVDSGLLVRSAGKRNVEELWSYLGQALDRFPAAECLRYLRHCGYTATTA